MRVLITQSSFANIAGSEVHAFELAQYLRSAGHEVILYAWFQAFPMARIIESAGFEVYLPEDPRSGQLNAARFDLVWCQHEVLPVALLESWNTSEQKPLMVFTHLSPFQELHIEHPYQFQLEAQIADVITFNSRNTRTAQQELFAAGEDSRCELFENPAPLGFVHAHYTQRTELQRLLVISNHPPQELDLAVKILREQGYQADYLSDTAAASKDSVLVSPQLLASYDCVITIGKTVQYCLVMGVPVYVYDHFGGPGYLDSRNYNQARDFNFSGRMEFLGATLAQVKAKSAKLRRTGDQIAHELISGYDAARYFASCRRGDFQDYFAIDTCFEKILSAAQANRIQRPAPQLSPEYLHYLLSTQEIMRDRAQLSYRVHLPQRLFYNQPIQLFMDSGQGFSETKSRLLPGELAPRTQLAIPDYFQGRPVRAVRIDFGEQACVVANISVTAPASTQYSIRSNAALESAGMHIFLRPDPQVIVDFTELSAQAAPESSLAEPKNPKDAKAGKGENNVSTAKQIALTAQVYPLDNLPDTLWEQLSQSLAADAADLADYRTPWLIRVLKKIKRRVKK